MKVNQDLRRLTYQLVALGFCMMLLSTCIKGVYQIYFSELATHFGRGRSEFAWSGSIFMLVTGLVSPFVGFLSDRHGPLRTVFIGTLAGGVALVGASLFHDSLMIFVLAYGVFGAFGLAAMTYVPMGVLVDRLFEHKNTGFAYAVVTNGTAIGFIFLSPFWLWLQPQFEWTRTFLVTGLVFLFPASAVAWFAANRADTAGLGRTEVTAAPKLSAWKQVRSDSGFYALALGFFGCGATMAFIDVHLVAFWQDAAAPRSLMGLSLSLLGMLELLSGLATGWLAMHFKKHSLLALFYLLRTCAMLLLLGSNSMVYTLAFATVFGASYLGTVVLTSMYCLERYGRSIKGQAFGLLFLAHQAGAFLSVQLGAIGYDRYGSYVPIILVMSILTIFGGFSCWLNLHKSVAFGSDSRPGGLAFPERNVE
jgi:MFS family permease